MDDDEIPKFAQKQPMKRDFEIESNETPQGFCLFCPYSGFDPDSADRLSTQISPSHNRQEKVGKNKSIESANNDRIHYQDYTTRGTLELMKRAYVTPEK